MTSDVFNHWQLGFAAYHSCNPTNTSVSWYGTDSLENFKNNPHPDYTETSITYKFNSKGFRAQEFDFSNIENNILCFGCSHTAGTAVQEPWPCILQQELPEYKVYNLGHGAGSSDTVCRLMTNYVPLLKPKKVFILWPSLTRFELYNTSGVMHIGPWHKHISAKSTTEETRLNWSKKNKIYAGMLSKIYNFELFEDQESKWTKKPGLLDWGRDHAHPGSKTHVAIAKNFMNKFQP